MTSAVATHSHEWHASVADRVWRCSKPSCGAWISRLVNQKGQTIPLPKDRQQ